MVRFIHQMFADDTQLHSASEPGHYRSLITDSESCIESIKVWTIQNKLKPNDDKSEAGRLSFIRLGHAGIVDHSVDLTMPDFCKVFKNINGQN